MSTAGRIIHLRVEAPAKPATGAPCNGCGVCCATEPCPLGMVLSGRRSGTCTALRWDAGRVRYTCGAIVAPREVLPRGLRLLAPLIGRLAPRWVAAGQGCDADLEAEPAPDRPGTAAADRDR